MNFSSYGIQCSKFYGFQTYNVREDMIVFNLTHWPWESWFVPRLYPANKILTSKKHALVQALQVYLKSESQCSIFCKDDSWTILMGKEHVIIPMENDKSTFQLYLTTLYVRDPNIIEKYLQGIARPAYDHVYTYKNTVFFLDKNTLPYPGGRYFNKPQSDSNYYRLCFLTDEPTEKVAKLVSDWRLRRDVSSTPFLSQVAVSRPKFLCTQPVQNIEFSDMYLTMTGSIRKKLCNKNPNFILHDVIESYVRHYERTSSSLPNLNNLGIVLQWPCHIAFETSRVEISEDKRYVAIVVNGNRPDRVLHVHQPFEWFREFNRVPAVAWTSISYEPNVLKTNTAIEKLSMDSIVLGFTYRKAFFCFGNPLFEGRPCQESKRNTTEMFNLANESILNDSWITVIESFRFDPNHSLYRVKMKDVPHDSWCLSKADDSDAYPNQFRLPSLVRDWLNLYTLYHGVALKDKIDVNLVRLALVLARHKICFKMEISDKKNEVVVMDNDIKLKMAETATNFVNSIRLEENFIAPENEAVDSRICSIM